MRSMNIGRLAELGGVNIDTIRYYERQKVLPPPARSASGYRRYGETDLERLRFIRRSKELGFSLTEIKDLLSLTQDRGSDMRGVKRKAEQRLEQVERKIAELRRVKRGLKTLIAACPGKGELRGCPIVAALSGGAARPETIGD
jgi:MerR family transcriptional regulator, copper efflux regulator